MALPVSSKNLQLKAIGLYRSDTLKKLIFHMGIHVLINLGLSPLIFESLEDTAFKNRHQVDEWLPSMRLFFGCSDLKMFIVWPSESNKKRVYLHFMTREGETLGFAKVALSAEENENIQNESNTLNSFNTKGLTNFKVPKLLRDDWFGEHRYILLEPVPKEARPVRVFSEKVHMKAIHEFSRMQRAVLKQDLESCSWVRKYQSALQVNQHFTDDIFRMCQNQGIRTCRIHGDFGPSNVLTTKTVTWIIDWEESCVDGPCLTDIVSYILASRRKMVLRNPHKGLRFLISEMRKLPLDATKVDIAMALAFLHGSRFTLATKIIESWPVNNIVWPIYFH